MTIRKSLGRLLTDFRRRRVERALTHQLPGWCSAMEVRIAAEPSVRTRHLITLRKEGRRLVLAFDYRRLLRNSFLFRIYRNRPGVLLEAFCRTGPDVTELKAEISDGRESAEGLVSFCSALSGAVLVPDPDFYHSRGYAAFRAPGAAWLRRDPTLVWRGVSSGIGVIAADEMAPGNEDLIQRTRLCLALRDVRGTDAKLTRVVQSREPRRDLSRLRTAGILGEPLPALSWRERKFALDIDGNGNAWSNLFTRMLLGCCVIKVGSPLGFRQWYYGALRPFEHFVPVAADLSDLVEKIEWCRAHDPECAAIAAAGRAFALERTFEREMAAAVESISEMR